MKIDILGTPFNGLGTPPDIENPAEGLRQAGLVMRLAAKGHRVNDLGDLSGFYFEGRRDRETGVKDFQTWIELSKCLSKTVRDMLERESFALLLGGDCSMLLGILLALDRQERAVGLVFLDGHADFHTPETSPTGDPADMELAVVTGRGPDSIVRMGRRYPLIQEDHVLVAGIRAWDHIADSHIRVVDANRLKETGIQRTIEKAIGEFTQKSLPIWLHFDVDVLDPEWMPVMFPEPGGLTFKETQAFMRRVWSLGHVIGMSVACYHPTLDTDGRAGVHTARLIADVLSGPRHMGSATAPEQDGRPRV